MKTCILHIGTHKTGTSSTQKFLHTHNQKNRNYLYPLTILDWDLSHNLLGLAIITNDISTTQLLLNKLKNEVENNSADFIVISSEMLEKAVIIDNEAFNIFYNFLKTTFSKIEIVYCIRNAFNLCNSVFKQRVITEGYHCEVDGFIDDYFVNEIKFQNIITAWEKKKVTVKVFTYTPIDNTTTFLSVLPFSFSVDVNTSVKRINPSLDGKMLELCYSVNKIGNLKRFDTTLIRKYIQAISKLKNFPENFIQSSYIIPDDCIELYRDSFNLYPSTKILNKNLEFYNYKANFAELSILQIKTILSELDKLKICMQPFDQLLKNL